MIIDRIRDFINASLDTDKTEITKSIGSEINFAKEVDSIRVKAAAGTWVARFFVHKNKKFVQVQDPDGNIFYEVPLMAEGVEKNKIVVPNLKPRDPNYEILKSKRNAGGAHKDKKRAMKNGDQKYKEKITFKEYLMVEAPMKGSDKVEDHPYSVKILYKGKGQWPKLKGEIYEHDVLIGTFSRDAVQGGYVPPIEYKFRTERSKARFEDFADSLSIEETIESLLPRSALGQAE